MSAAYIDADYIDAFLGADVRAALFTTPTVAYSATHLGVVINAASALVKMAAKNAGYTLADTTTDDTVKLATLAEFIKMAPGMRKGLTLAENFVAEFGGTMEAIRSGDLPLDSTPSDRAAVGGVEHSNTDDTITGVDAWPAIFSRSGLRNY